MLFAKQTTGTNDDIGQSIGVDSLGNTYVAGRFSGTVDFDPGPGIYSVTANPGNPRDAYLLKLDANSDFLWVKIWGSTGDETAYSLQVDPSGYIYVYGTFEGNVDFDPGPGSYVLNAPGASADVYFSKFDFSGNFIWAKSLWGSNDAYGMSMTLDKQGNLYAAGYVHGTHDVDPSITNTIMVGAAGVTSLFVAKYDSSGALQWGKAMIGSAIYNYNNCHSVSVDPWGNVYTTGCFMGTIDFDPGPGTYNLTNTTIDPEIYISKFDSSGNLRWAKQLVPSASVHGCWGRSVLADDSGNVYYTGAFRGTVDFDPGPGSYPLTNVPGWSSIFLSKLDSLGNMKWSFQLASDGNHAGYSLAMDSTNHIMLSGVQWSDSLDYDPSPGVYMVYGSGPAENLFIARYSPAGSVKCVTLIESGYLQMFSFSLAHQLAVYGQKAYLTGGFVNTSDFDPCPAVHNQTALNNFDAFMAAYDFSSCDCALQLAQSSTDVLCNGNCSGSATVNPLGGAPPYTYNWLPSGGNGNTATNLCAGSYTCVVVDALGDTVNSVITITEPSLLTATISSTDLQCNSVCSGSAIVIPSGGSFGYSYAWSNSQTNDSISSLCAGNYSVTVTDSNGCTTQESITITQPGSILATISSTPTPCYDSAGSLSILASGGTGSLHYLWLPGGDTGSIINNLPAGIYSVTVTDQNGCTFGLSDTIAAIGSPVTNVAAVIDVMCHGDSTGSALVNVTGSGPFTYQWFPIGGSDSTANDLVAGFYTVLVTDNQGCTQTDSVLISEPPLMSAVISSATDTCSRGVGSLTLQCTGGVGPYTFLWSNTQTDSSITGLSGGTYSVTITDSYGCTLDTSTLVISTIAPTLSVSNFSNVLCFGDSTGTATIGTSGGAAPFTFAWLPFGSTSATANGLSAGTYSVAVTGSDGCSDTISVAIGQPPQLQVSCQAIDENCNNQDGAAFVQTSGGVGGYSFAWSNSSASDTIFQLSAGLYSVVITDLNGCSETCAVIVATTATANASAGADVTIETGQTTGLYGSGGVYYSWQPAAEVDCNSCAVTTTSPTVTTTFVLTVTDSAGCTDFDTVIVFVEIPCDDIFVPNAFSPNGDLQNDVLYVRGTCIETFTFFIFNRWGELVFQTSDQSIGWDGSWRGVQCENAVFNYVLKGISTNGDPFEQQGNVSLIR